MAPILAWRSLSLSPAFYFCTAPFFQESNFQPICRFIPPIFYARALEIEESGEREQARTPFTLCMRAEPCLLLGSCVISLGEFMGAVSRFAALSMARERYVLWKTIFGNDPNKISFRGLFMTK